MFSPFPSIMSRAPVEPPRRRPNNVAPTLTRCDGVSESSQAENNSARVCVSGSILRRLQPAKNGKQTHAYPAHVRMLDGIFISHIFLPLPMLKQHRPLCRSHVLSVKSGFQSEPSIVLAEQNSTEVVQGLKSLAGD